MVRSGDTKLLCHVAQMIIALSGVSLWPLSGGKSLVLCQPRTSAEGASPSQPRGVIAPGRSCPQCGIGLLVPRRAPIVLGIPTQ
jgi:hypothetical protein